MTQVITAVYERGVLRPLKRLRLAENQTVQLQILTESEVESAETIVQRLVADGLLTPPPEPTATPIYSQAERQQAAELLGRAAAIPPSQLITQARGEM